MRQDQKKLRFGVTVSEASFKRRWHSPARQLFLSCAVSALMVGVAQAGGALPTGGVFSAGSGTIAGTASTVTVNQATSRAIINWSSFSIGAGNSVQINNGTGATLNRVTGGGVSQIAGSLSATGSVYIVNQAGVVVLPGGQVVSAGSFVASTRDVSDTGFMAGGALQFQGNSSGTVVNQGTITSTGGDIVLIGQSVTNSGQMNAASGTVSLAAGESVLLQPTTGDQRVFIATGSGNVTNSGGIAAAQAELNAAGGNVYALAGNNGNIVRATGTSTVNGRVWLTAGGDATVSGTIAAANADGSGGTVTVKSAGTTNFSGTIVATGSASGDGGSVEVSGRRLVFTGSVDLRAARGKTGTLLLDPGDLYINTAGTTTDADASAISVATLQSNLATGNVTLTATASGADLGDITVQDGFTWSTGSSLTLSAANNIVVNAPVSHSGAVGAAITLTTGANGSLIVNSAGLTNNVFSGVVTLVAYDSLTINNQAYTLISDVSQIFRTDHYALYTDDATSVTGPLLTGPIFSGVLDGLGHSISGLSLSGESGANVGLFGSIAVGGRVSNLGFVGATVTGVNIPAQFLGVLTGLNNGTIANSWVDGTSKVKVMASTNQTAGGLVGENLGTIRSSRSAAVVSGGATDGGLVGLNSKNSSSVGQIIDSYATASVNVSNSDGVQDGGLVGWNQGTISASYATGTVLVGENASAGGLVGKNEGAIDTSYATGIVSSNGDAGGLVGENSGSISNSYATGGVGVTGGLGVVHVTGDVGGLVGSNVGTVTASYWNKGSTVTGGKGVGSGSATGVTGLSDAAMKQQSSFSGWDFAGTWVVYNGHTDPLLQAFLTPLTVTAGSHTKTYDGLSYTNDGVTYSVTPNANLLGALDYDGAVNAGTYAPSGFYSNQHGYLITYVGGTLTVNQAPLTVTGVTANGKVYDGTNAATLSGVPVLSGFVSLDAGSLTGTTAAFATANAGSGIVVTVTGYILSMTTGLASNYTLVQPTGLTADITSAALTVTPSSGQTKVYGADDPTLTYTATGLANSDDYSVFTGALSRETDEGIGSYVITRGTLSAGSNYSLTFTSGVTFSITAAPLTVTPNSGQTKIYGAGDPTLTYIATGLVNGDNYSVFTGALSRTSGENFGNYAITQGTLVASANYSLSFTPGVSFSIAAAPLTVTPDSGQTKIYGASDPMLTYTATGLTNGDGYSVFIGTLSRAMGENSGNYAITQGTLVASSNYSLSFTPGVTFSIAEAPLTVTPSSGQTKIYGAGDPILTYTATGLTNGDDYSVFTGALSRITGENFGNYAITQGTLVANSNYSLSFTPGVTFSIAAAPLTVTPGSGQTKTYGTDDPTLTYMATGLVNGDDYSVFAGALSRGAGENVGSYDVIRGTLSAGSNYSLSFTSGVQFSITSATLTVTGMTANSKPSDGTTVASLSGTPVLSGLVSPDAGSVTGAPTAAFATAEMGDGIAVTVTGYGFSLSTGLASNYTFTQPTGLTANITAPLKPILTVTGITASNKVYDGTTAATLSFTGAVLSGVQPGDVGKVALGTSGYSASFASAGVGMGITVTVTGLTLTGSAASSYTLMQPTGVTASITAKPLTVTGVIASNKPYDGTTAATLNVGGAALVGVLAGDIGNVSLDSGSYAANFASASAGTNKGVTVTGLGLAGEASSDYSLTQPTGFVASITPAPLTITISANSRAYNGTTAATLNIAGAVLDGLVPGDAVGVSASGYSAAFATAGVGSGKPVTVSGLSLTGAKSVDYTLTQPTDVTGTITTAALTISNLTAASKIYDGTTTATVSGTGALVGIVSGDSGNVALSGTPAGNFATPNIGTAIAVTVTGYSLTGVSSGNYTLTQPTLHANITVATLTIGGLSVQAKTYDGTKTATLAGTPTAIGAAAVDVGAPALLSIVGAGTGTFATANAGTGIGVTVSSYSLTGTDAGNYKLTQPTGLTGTITKAPVTITGGVTASNKVYDGTTKATLTFSGVTYSGVAAPDVGLVTLNTAGYTANFATADVGAGQTVTISGISFGGAAANNYTLTAPSTLTANITGATLTVAGLAVVTRAYDGTTTATLDLSGATFSGFKNATDATNITLSGTYTAAFALADAGTSRTVTVSSLGLTGTGSSNYTVVATTTRGTITPKVITVTGITVVTRSANGSTIAQLVVSGAALSGVLAGDTVSVSGANYTANFDTAAAGTGKTVTVSTLNLSGAKSLDYVIQLPLTLSGTIAP